MSLLTLQNLGFDYGRLTVLDGVNLTLAAGERYGLVGVNGAGKSTLLRLLAGAVEPSRGSLQRAQRVSVGHLPQDRELLNDAPLRQAVLAVAFGEILEWESRLEELTRRMGAGDDSPALLAEYGSLHERFEAADGYSVHARCDAALQGLGFAPERLEQPVRTLSGGQRRRAALAAVLVARHDVLLLDEPTNHLDLEAREWLEAHLRERKGCLMAISHDRAFLDNTTQLTLHLINAQLRRYTGGYTRFRQQWDRERVQWETRYRQQQQTIERTEAFIRKNIAGQRTGQAKSRRKQLARLERIEAPPNEGQRTRFDLAPRRASGQVVFEGKGLSHRFEGVPLFSGLDFQILRGEKLGILGPNGTGKTTLLRLLLGETTPRQGSVVVGRNVDVGYYDQDLSLVVDGHSVLEEIRRLQPETSEGDLRSLLAAFGFGADRVEQTVGTLSGGERARLSLLHLILEGHNTLLLDEPTNHLDTDAREALEAALATFTGTLVVVSHDRYFLNRICDRLFAFETSPGGVVAVRQVLGTYDDYRRLLQTERRGETAAQAGRARSKGSAAKARGAGAVRAGNRDVARAGNEDIARAKPRGAARRGDASAGAPGVLSKNDRARLRREAADLEEEIVFLESDLEDLGRQMSSGALAGNELGRAADKAREVQETLDAKMARWEEISRLLERPH